MKCCSSKDCTQSNPQDFSNFNLSKERKDGYHAYCKTCVSRLRKIYKIRNPQKFKDSSRRGFLKYFYGMTVDDYDKKLVEQKHCCAICKGHSLTFSKALHVDHCHATGKIRGLLCANCNHILGKAGDQVKTLRAAIRYLEEHDEGKKR